MSIKEQDTANARAAIERARWQLEEAFVLASKLMRGLDANSPLTAGLIQAAAHLIGQNFQPEE